MYPKVITFTHSNGYSVTIEARDDIDVNILIDVVNNNSYVIDKLYNNVDTFIDLGSCYGAASLLAKKIGYKQVIGVEILQNNIEQAYKNMELNSVKYEILHNAIHDTSDNIVFADRCDGDINKNMGFIVQEHHKPKFLEIASTINLHDIITKRSVQKCVIKTKCEGAEWYAFRNLSNNILSKIKYIVGGLHYGSIHGGGICLQDFLDYFNGRFIDVSKEFNTAYDRPMPIIVLENQS